MVDNANRRRLSKRTRWRFRQLGYTNAQAEALAACGATPSILLSYLDGAGLDGDVHRYRLHKRFAGRVDAIRSNNVSDEPEALSAIGQLATDAAPAGIRLDEALWWGVLVNVPRDEFTLISALPPSIRTGMRYHATEPLYDICDGCSISDLRQEHVDIIGSGAVVADSTGDYALGVFTGGARLFETGLLDSGISLGDLDERIPADIQAFIALGGLAELAELHSDCEQYFQQFVNPVIGRRLIVDPTGPPPPGQVSGESFWKVVHAIGQLMVLDAMADAYRHAYEQGRLSEYWADLVLTD